MYVQDPDGYLASAMTSEALFNIDAVVPKESGTGPQLLAKFLAGEDEIECQALLSRLAWDEAAPIVRKIVTFKISGHRGAEKHPEIEDVVHDILADLIARLRALKASADLRTIRDFRGYVAVSSYHGCNDHFRRKYPQRHRLRNKLRYLLLKDRRFALWEESNGEWFCGRKEWNRNAARMLAIPLTDDEPDLAVQTRTRDAATQVAAILDQFGRAMPFDELVDRIAELWGIYEQQPVAENERNEVADPHCNTDADLERRAWLKRLWDEVKLLPLRQRWALLLNMREDQGGAAISLLPATGVASIREIAKVLDMPAEVLAGIWNELPFEDTLIAAQLGATRQQVINLRKSARERLLRRLTR